MISTITAIATLLVWGSSAWVYWDATANKIGKIPGEKGFFNMSAGAWTCFALFLWVAGFPLYLQKRQSLIERAKAQPVEVKRRGLKLAIICVFGALGVYGSFEDSASDEKIAKRPSPDQGTQNVPAPKAPGGRPAQAPTTAPPRAATPTTSIATTSTTPQERPVTPQTASMPRTEAAPSLQKPTDAAPSTTEAARTATRVQRKTDDMEASRRRAALEREAETKRQVKATTSACVYKPVMSDEDIAKCR